ncbi:MAG: NADH-quinone oxidoreductase subunit J family protein [Tranquillimonas sp.]
MNASIIVLILVAVYTGWRVFQADSMVRATFALLVSFIAVAGIGVILSVPYIGVATVFMMAVEMMVMAIFMVAFMMNSAGLNPMSMVHQEKPAMAAGLLTWLGLSAAVLTSRLPDNPVPADNRAVRDLGIELLGDSMLTFETGGVALLATMVGAVILSSRRGRYGPADEGAQPPGLMAGGAPAGRRPEEGGGHHHGHGGHDMGGGEMGGHDMGGHGSGSEAGGEDMHAGHDMGGQDMDGGHGTGGASMADARPNMTGHEAHGGMEPGSAATGGADADDPHRAHRTAGTGGTSQQGHGAMGHSAPGAGEDARQEHGPADDPDSHRGDKRR